MKVSIIPNSSLHKKGHQRGHQPLPDLSLSTDHCIFSNFSFIHSFSGGDTLHWLLAHENILQYAEELLAKGVHSVLRQQSSQEGKGRSRRGEKKKEKKRKENLHHSFLLDPHLNFGKALAVRKNSI